MKSFLTIKIVPGIALLALLMCTGCAKDDEHSDNRHQGPPPEALQACSGKQAGDTVEFKGRRGETVTAVCREMNGALVAVPEGASPKGARND
ncbi:hypothetical protein [Desulforhopalus sp. IMCC35007]|uniref:hypothetical protein n=1 Tax=Desulforhopalus sp. IMCC35007 TaxID=2569543 RepID=UPI0010AE9152|nr:hypothetical protein [Desulforhopalus sp. IMCC35007]TKB12247.1 hypothetical protein FCL48_00935 [Desulforhopalus sp. IMCC35007]